jgi:Arc/MetJ-type ribon-helix-helix transcriptional regulator
MHNERRRGHALTSTAGATVKHMEVNLSPDQLAFVRRAIASGRLHDEHEAVQEALALWEERERRRLEITASVESARAVYGRGEGRPITAESMRALASEVKSRGRSRLATQKPRQG